MRSPYAAFLLVIFAHPVVLGAQACLGTPTRGGIAYQNVRYTVGSGHGATAAFAPGKVAFGAHFNTRTNNAEKSGNEGGGRFAVVVPLGRVQLCHGIQASFYSGTWNAPAGVEVKSQVLTAKAGAGIGLEQPIYRGLSIIPSVGVHYAFTVTKFDVNPPSGEVTTSGDTLSQVAIDYAVLARFRFIYGGVSGLRYADTKGGAPAMARYIIGFAFGGNRAAKKD